MKSEIIWQRVEGALILLTGIWVYNSLGGAMPWYLLVPAFFAPPILRLRPMCLVRAQGPSPIIWCMTMALGWSC